MAIASATRDIASLDLKAAQDVIKCDLCSNSVELQCNRCDVRLCGQCVSKHVSKIQTTHEIVTFIGRKSDPILPTCQFHLNAKCELKCLTCDSVVCSKCITTVHKFHDIADLMEIFKSKLDTIHQDVYNLEKICVPQYQNMISNTESRLSTLEPEYQLLKSAIKKHGQDIHRMVDVVTKRFEDEAEKMEKESVSTLKNRVSELSSLLTDIQDLIKENRRLLQSNDVTEAISYNVDMGKFKTVKSEMPVPVPDFRRVKITTEEMCNLFGTLETSLKGSFKEKSVNVEADKEKKADKAVKEGKDFLLMPSLSAIIDTSFEQVQRIACHDKNGVWVSGNKSDIVRIDGEGNVLEIVHTGSGYVPHDLAVSQDKELLYCDNIERTVKMVQNKNQRALLRYEMWRPQGICVTSEGGILVSLYNELEGHSKVMKYAIQRQIEENQELATLQTVEPKLRMVIQYDERGESLFRYATFIAENVINNDVCVSDHGINSVVVVSQEGKFKFIYNNVLSQRKFETFFPCSIATDSQGHILIADGDNDCVHVISSDRHFLCYVDNCDVSGIYGIDVDSSDKLWIGEVDTGKIKVIQYLNE
ncbi:uncharacterized protein LOC130047615 [Ostrea edulis]|uniref:uncharacterized protein LOC130047615 n=1 Tax=Ostrea edulis TaxID=37623 RepID=UPI0024AF4757|nr:uncharacterized protein LOC130047615 [Ostrea edulis]